MRWLALAALACNAPADKPGTSDTDPADTDTDADADTDSDTDTNVDTDTDTVPTDPTTDVTAPTITAYGGCIVPIPADALVIDRDTTLTDPGVVAWVCRNKTASVSGSDGAFYVESNGSLVVSGDRNVIYARSGADLAVFSADNTFYLEDSADLQDEGTGNILFPCATFEFDLALAPPSGC